MDRRNPGRHPTPDPLRVRAGNRPSGSRWRTLADSIRPKLTENEVHVPREIRRGRSDRDVHRHGAASGYGERHLNFGKRESGRIRRRRNDGAGRVIVVRHQEVERLAGPGRTVVSGELDRVRVQAADIVGRPDKDVGDLYRWHLEEIDGDHGDDQDHHDHDDRDDQTPTAATRKRSWLGVDRRGAGEEGRWQPSTTRRRERGGGTRDGGTAERAELRVGAGRGTAVGAVQSLRADCVRTGVF